MFHLKECPTDSSYNRPLPVHRPAIEPRMAWKQIVGEQSSRASRMTPPVHGLSQPNTWPTPTGTDKNTCTWKASIQFLYGSNFTFSSQEKRKVSCLQYRFIKLFGFFWMWNIIICLKVNHKWFSFLVSNLENQSTWMMSLIIHEYANCCKSDYGGEIYNHDFCPDRFIKHQVCQILE